MAQILKTERGVGTISRIFFDYGDAGAMTGVQFVLAGSNRLYNARVNGVDQLTRLKLTKPGDEVSFTQNKQKSFLLGEHFALVEWQNRTLEKELAGDGLAAT